MCRCCHTSNPNVFFLGSPPPPNPTLGDRCGCVWLRTKIVEPHQWVAQPCAVCLSMFYKLSQDENGTAIATDISGKRFNVLEARQSIEKPPPPTREELSRKLRLRLYEKRVLARNLQE